MDKYQENKEKVRQVVIEWQHTFFERNDSYYNLMTYQEYFEKYGKRYGLLKEFRENCII